MTSWRRLSGPRATGWRDALATPPPPSRLPLSRYATRARLSPAKRPGRQLEIVHLELSSPAFDPPAARPTRTTQLTLSPASSFDDMTARTRQEIGRRRRRRDDHRDPDTFQGAQHRSPVANGGNLKDRDRRYVHPGVPHEAPRDRVGRPLQGQVHPRVLPPVRRPGGGVRRHGSRPHEGGCDRHLLPRSLHAPRPRGDASGGHGGADGEGRRREQGHGREHAHVQTRRELLRGQRHRRCVARRPRGSSPNPGS